MYIAMNQFRVRAEQAEAFERAWRDRDSYLHEVPGFREFHLLRGPVEDGVAIYSSHAVWQDEASFRAWTTSEQFRKAHARASLGDMLLGPPKLTGWTAVAPA